MAFKPIQILINAKDEASSVFDKLSTKIAAVGATVAGYFGIKSFVGAVQGAADLEAAISKVAAAADGGEAELQALRDAAEQAGQTTAFTAVEAAGALENLVKAGLSAKDAIQALPAVMALSEAGGIELAQAADVVTKSIAGMGLAIEDAGRVADVLVKGANASNSSVEGLSQAFATAAPVAQSLGVSLEGTTAILGKMADAGIDASRSGTALANMLGQFSDPASSFRRELAAIGITTSDFEQAMHQLADAGGRGEKAILAVGKNAGPALRALLNQGMPALDDLKRKLLESQGAAADTAATMANNLQGSMRSLGAVWDSVKNTLGAPVLPVLTDGVNRLTNAFRAAIADGVIDRFGKAIASAFEAGIKWAREFLANVDFSAMAQRLSNFASEAQDTFTRIGDYASRAGTIVQTAWAVMAGGTQTVLAGVYKLGDGFATVASRITDGLAWLAEQVSKITFGGLSESFARAAEEMRISAGGMWAASEALADKASEAFDAAARHAQDARDGFATLGGAAADATRQIASATGQTIAIMRDVGKAALDAAADAARASTQQQQAAADAQAAIAALRDEYKQAIDTGNTQRAAEVMLELKAATQAAASASRDLAREQKDAAAQIAAAFERAGIKTKEQLADMARLARQDFELVKQSGLATAADLATAWKRAADAAIAANDGIVPGWVSAQAAAHGYAVELGKLVDAHNTVGASGEAAGHRAAAGWRQAASAAQTYFDTLKNAPPGAREDTRFDDDRYASTGEELGKGVIEIGRGQFQNKDGWASDAKGNPIMGREDDALRNQRIAALFGEDMIGNANAEAAYALQKRIDMLTKHAGSLTGGDGSLGLLRKELDRLRAAVEADRIAKQREAAGGGGTTTTGGGGRSGPTATGGRASSSGIAYVNNINLGGVTRRIDTADAASTQALQDLLAELQRARGVVH